MRLPRSARRTSMMIRNIRDRSRPGLNDVIVINAVVPRIAPLRSTVWHLPPGNGEIRRTSAHRCWTAVGRWAGTSLATPPPFWRFDASCHLTDPRWPSWHVAPSDRFYTQNQIHWRVNIDRCGECVFCNPRLKGCSVQVGLVPKLVMMSSVKDPGSSCFCVHKQCNTFRIECTMKSLVYV